MLEINEKSPVALFEEFMKQNKPEHTVLYKDLLEQVRAVYHQQVENPEERKEIMAPLMLKEGEELEPKRMSEHKNCEKILAEYLCSMSSKVNEKFFMTLVIFARLYKDCMNENGWNILGKYKTITAEERTAEFAKTNDAEHLPETCNVFINQYLLKDYPNFDQNIASDLTFHLCEWLYSKEYTHTRISQV